MKNLQKQFGAVVVIGLVLVLAGFVYQYAIEKTGPSDTEQEQRAMLPRDESASNSQNAVVEIDGVPVDERVVNEEVEDLEEPHVVTYIGSGFSPSTLKINEGDTVVFYNESTSQVWPASANHPLHTVYPGSSISLCGSSQESSIFDSCGAFNDGEEWSFTFDKHGSWEYHNHVKAGHRGIIIVE